MQHEDKTTGVESDNESMKLGSTGATDEADELALIEEAISETELDTTEGTDLLSGTETETEEARNENVIHPYLQVPTVHWQLCVGAMDYRDLKFVSVCIVWPWISSSPQVLCVFHCWYL